MACGAYSIRHIVNRIMKWAAFESCHAWDSQTDILSYPRDRV